MNQQVINDIKRQLARWQHLTSPPPLPKDTQEAPRAHYRLEWQKRPADEPSPPGIGLVEARLELTDRLHDYAYSRPNYTLIVQAQPGIGKTYAAIELAQELAARGKRVFYLMPTHKHFNTLSRFPNFDYELWYHWLSIQHDLPGGEEGDKMCRLSVPAQKWMAKGYKLKQMCDMLCPTYQPMCPYRCQSQVPQKIIAGVHEHLISGVAISHFNTMIVDEMPLRAFIQPQEIAADDLVAGGTSGLVHELQTELQRLARVDKIHKGRSLLEKIGPVLMDVFAAFDEVGGMTPEVPWLTQPSEVEDVGFWYLENLLTLLATEYGLWRSDAEQWMERVIVGKGRLLMLTGAKLWKKVPDRLIVLDATANAELYEQMFRRPVRVYRPNVAMRGKIHQITHRYNGKTTMLNGRRLAKQGKEAWEIVRRIAAVQGYVSPAVVTFKQAEAAFRHGGFDTAHFFGQRGSNDLEGCDGLFVVGTPTPPDHGLMNMVAMLNQDRTSPFTVKRAESGGIIPIRSLKRVSYRLTVDGMIPTRYVSGFWHDPELRALHNSLCTDELLQAIHRARPLTREVDVWLLSSQEVGETLTEIYDTPEKPLDCPAGVSWRYWLLLMAWLEQRTEPFTNQDMADATGASIHTVRNQRWMHHLIDLNLADPIKSRPALSGPKLTG